MRKYSKELILFFTIFSGTSLAKVIMEFIDDTPLEFNHRKVIVFSAMALASGIVALVIKKKTRPEMERAEDNSKS